MLGAPPANCAEDQRHIQKSEDAEKRAEQSAAIGFFDQGAQHKKGGVEQPQDERGSEAGVPSPPKAPDRMGPDGTGDQHDSREGQANFGGGDAEPIEFLAALPNVKEIGDKADEKRRESSPGAGHMQIKNTLDESHGAFFG